VPDKTLKNYLEARTDAKAGAAIIVLIVEAVSAREGITQPTATTNIAIVVIPKIKTNSNCDCRIANPFVV
jgi:hypothetical protein